MNPKPWWKSKMIWFAILTCIVSILGTILTNNPDLKIASELGMLVSVINMVLRLLSDKAIE